MSRSFSPSQSERVALPRSSSSPRRPIANGTDFGTDCDPFLPPNKVEITQQVCADGPSPYVYSPDGVHDAYGNPIQNTGCSSYRTEGTGVYADPQLYGAVKDVAAKSQLNLVKNMLGVATGKGGRAANPFNIAQHVTDQLVAVNGETKTLIRTNGCGSPGLRNFQSNLIRFANGEAPMKYAGAVVSAPVAVLPGVRDADFTRLNPYARFTAADAHQSPFGDGCNAFMKAPRTSRFAPRDPEGYCQCLSNGYQKVMPPAEEVFYGKNFEDKFWRGIAQPRSDDPAWPRLNPVAVSCMQ